VIGASESTVFEKAKREHWPRLTRKTKHRTGRKVLPPRALDPTGIVRWHEAGALNLAAARHLEGHEALRRSP
jgi:hypothetical protein